MELSTWYLLDTQKPAADQNGNCCPLHHCITPCDQSTPAHQTGPSRPRFQDVNLCLFQSALFSDHSPIFLTPWDCILRRTQIVYGFYLVIVKPLDLDQNTELYCASVPQGGGVNDMSGFF